MKQPAIYYRQQLQNYLEGTLPACDVEGLLHYLATEEGEQLADSVSGARWEGLEAARLPASPGLSGQMKQRLMKKVGHTATVHRIHFLRTAWFRYAASILLLLGVSTYLWLRPVKEAEPDLAGDAGLKTTIQPGKAGAILTLANGNTIVLDSLNDGLVAAEDGSDVVLADGRLTYNKALEAAAGRSFNTLTTPKGRQFQVTLPDGTKVWLNAASSIKYATVFTGNERRVEVAGEAYFEIKANARMPFIVNAGKTEVRVLGTSFNINAYPDEPVISTTLVEGSVQVKTPDQSQMLIPGEQAEVGDAATINVVKNADVQNVLAWKNGMFAFRGARIEQIMRQLSRWYNVEVRYEGPIPQHSFVGKISKSYDLSEVLGVLQASNVRFKMVNDTVVIRK